MTMTMAYFINDKEGQTGCVYLFFTAFAEHLLQTKSI